MISETGMSEIKVRPDLRSMTEEELRSFLGELGEKPFRADQIFRWMHRDLAASPEEMTNISKALREKLRENADYVTLKKADVRISKIDGTRKYLFALPDGNVIESVFMRYHHGNSVCVSSQAGCRMGCRFCASTIDGLARNLLPSEILGQVYEIIRDTGERVSNIVIMGSGEPLDNYDNVLRFIRLITHEKGQNISQRNITLSPASGDWPKRAYPLRWPFLSMRPTTGYGKASCPSRRCTNLTKFLMHVIITLKRPDAA